jgi:predicted dehydrogenase
MKILFIGTDGVEKWKPLIQGHEIAFLDGFDEKENSGAESGWLWNEAARIPTLEAGLERFKPDLAVIGVPNYRKNNPGIEILLLENGIPLFEHKFRTAAPEDFEKIYAVQRRTGTGVFMGEFYRHNPVVLTAKECLVSGGFGRPEFVKWDARIEEGQIHNWEAAYPHIALEDLAPHHFSAIQFLVGLDVSSVYTKSFSPRKGRPISGTLCLTIIEAGFLLQHTIDWHNSMTGRTSYLGDFSVACEQGGVRAVDGRVFSRRWGEEEKEIPITGKTVSPEAQTLGFISQKSGPQPGLLPGPQPFGIAEFAPVMRTIKYALDSVRSGLPVTPQPNPGDEVLQ